jgi:hypothetical protein
LKNFYSFTAATSAALIPLPTTRQSSAAPSVLHSALSVARDGTP